MNDNVQPLKEDDGVLRPYCRNEDRQCDGKISNVIRFRFGSVSDTNLVHRRMCLTRNCVTSSTAGVVTCSWSCDHFFNGTSTERQVRHKTLSSYDHRSLLET